MSTKVILSSVLAGAALLAGSAFADPPFEEGRYAPGGYDYARVVDVDPITRQVRIDTPRRECFQETRYRESDPRDYEGRRYRGTAGPSILGAVIGAGIGNTIGRGDGRAVATVAGAIIGSAVGHDIGEQRRQYDSGYAPEPAAYTQERCEVRYETSYQQRIEGYRVTYEYHGQRFVTQLPDDPGKRIRVRVSVEPDQE